MACQESQEHPPTGSDVLHIPGHATAFGISPGTVSGGSTPLSSALAFPAWSHAFGSLAFLNARYNSLLFALRGLCYPISYYPITLGDNNISNSNNNNNDSSRQ